MSIPHLRKTKTSSQLIVNGEPFLMLSAELHNSTLSSAKYMADDKIWQNMRAMYINTLLGSVSWEQIEPVEGQFDFSNLDAVILAAREHGIKLVLLWFGSFKNGITNSVEANFFIVFANLDPSKKYKGIRIPHHTPRPRCPDLDYIFDVSPDAHHALYTHHEHTGRFHTRGVQGIRSEILSHGSSGGRGKGRRCVSEIATEKRNARDRLEGRKRRIVGRQHEECRPGKER